LNIRFAAVNLNPDADGPEFPRRVKAIAEDDESRVNFLKACLAKLGLIISQETSSVPSLSRLHLSSSSHFLVPELLDSWENIITIEDGEEYIKGENDSFHLEKQDSRWSLSNLAKALPLPSILQGREVVADAVSDDRIVDYNSITKRLIPHETEWPGSKETPYFNHHAFFANLRMYQDESRGEAEDYGKHLMYGEVVTSTNTMLEKSIYLLLLEMVYTNMHSEIPDYFQIYPQALPSQQQLKSLVEVVGQMSGYHQLVA
jgi:biotin--protein ligase